MCAPARRGAATTPRRSSASIRSEPFSASRFLQRVHPDDRARFKAHVRGVNPEKSSYALTFRFIRPDGQEVWLEETSRAEFDAAGHFVLLKGLTRDITARKRAEERQDMLIAEFDHRVKNILARVAVVAMYTRQGSRSMDEFIQTLDGRIQSMATAHSLLSQSRWTRRRPHRARPPPARALHDRREHDGQRSQT